MNILFYLMPYAHIFWPEQEQILFCVQTTPVGPPAYFLTQTLAPWARSAQPTTAAGQENQTLFWNV